MPISEVLPPFAALLLLVHVTEAMSSFTISSPGDVRFHGLLVDKVIKGITQWLTHSAGAATNNNLADLVGLAKRLPLFPWTTTLQECAEALENHLLADSSTPQSRVACLYLLETMASSK